MENIFDFLEPICLKITPVGSRITCNPAPTNTDQDYLLLVKPEHEFAVLGFIKSTCFELGGSHPDNEAKGNSDIFWSFKHDDINLIVTSDKEFYGKFMAASIVAKRLNLLDKPDRIALFQAVLYGNASAE